MAVDVKDYYYCLLTNGLRVCRHVPPPGSTGDASCAVVVSVLSKLVMAGGGSPSINLECGNAPGIRASTAADDDCRATAAALTALIAPPRGSASAAATSPASSAAAITCGPGGYLGSPDEGTCIRAAARLNAQLRPPSCRAAAGPTPAACVHESPPSAEPQPATAEECDAACRGTAPDAPTPAPGTLGPGTTVACWHPPGVNWILYVPPPGSVGDAACAAVAAVLSTLLDTAGAGQAVSTAHVSCGSAPGIRGPSDTAGCDAAAVALNAMLSASGDVGPTITCGEALSCLPRCASVKELATQHTLRTRTNVPRGLLRDLKWLHMLRVIVLCYVHAHRPGQLPRFFRRGWVESLLFL